MSYQVLARKWRPKLFSEVVGQDHVVQALKNSILDEKVNQAYIFNGTRGVGKTSIARILTKALNCEKHIKGEPCDKCDHCLALNENSLIDFQEIDAASRRSREETMNLLETVPYLPASSRYKVYLIDEVHMLTKESFNALLKTLEEPPPHVIFMFATTEIDKVPATILSRCLQLNLRLLSEEEITKQLSKIFKEEKISFDDESLKIISKSASGSMRDALTISEKVVSYCSGKLKKEDVQTLLGIPSEEKIFTLLDILKDKDSKGLYEFFENFDENDSCQNLLESLMKSIQEISLMQFSPDKESNLSNYAEMTPEYLQLIYQIGLSNKIYFETSSDPKGLLSMTLIKMIAFCPEEKKNFKLGNLNSMKDDSLFDWDIVLRKIDLSTLLNQVLSFSSAKKDKKNLIISLPREKIERINDEYKKEIASTLNIYFNEILEISYDSNVDLNKTPAFIKEKLELKNSSEAVEMISNDEGFKKISSEFKTDIKNISKK